MRFPNFHLNLVEDPLDEKRWDEALQACPGEKAHEYGHSRVAKY